MDTLLDRFCRYVKVDTTAVEEVEAYPSTPGQKDLTNMLAGEMKALGLQDVSVSEWGIAMGTVPGIVKGAPTIAWIAHVDTSPESSGKDVKPIVHKNYDGRDIVLPGDTSKVIKVEDTDGMAELKGKTLITSDGMTLLGADDKAGCAVIMTAAAHLMANRNIQTGPIRLVFTCDEEVGRGVDKVTPAQIGTPVAYTLDGETPDCIENETFSADLATVTITGRNIHPGLAKGKMVNAIRIAAQFITRMPWHRLAPEAEEGKNGFLHPYTIEGGVGEAKIRILLRSFKTPELTTWKEILDHIAASIRAEHPRAQVDVAIKVQYRNMIEALEREPRAVALAAKAVEKVGLKPKFTSVRGGTDGSRLSEMGLPTPNLGTGMHNFHSPLEFACLEEMEYAVKVLTELAQLWAREKAEVA